MLPQLNTNVPIELGVGVGVGVAVGAGVGVGVAVDPGGGVGVIVGVGVGVDPGGGVGVGEAAGTGVEVGTAVAVGTGVGEPDGRVMNAVIAQFVSRAKIVPVLALTVSIPPNITVDPTTVGKAVTVMLVSCSYSPDSSGAGLKTNKPFTMPKTV